MLNINNTRRYEPDHVSENAGWNYHQTLRWLLLPVLLCIAAATAQAQEDSTVLVLGDSISSAYGLAVKDGWVAQLETRLSDENSHWNVVNASVTGDTSGNGLGRLAALLDEYQPRMVIIELGGNDGLRGLSIKKLQSNLISMAEMANGIGALPVIVTVQLPGNYGKAYNTLFSKTFGNAATQTDALLVPSLFEGMSAAAEWFQSDGIHPSAKAQPLMLDNVWKVIQPALEEALAQ